MLLCVEGCTGKIPAAVWPKIQISPAIVWTPEEAAKLKAFAAQEPEIARKLIGRNNEQAAAIETYNKKATENNRKVLTAVGYTEEQVEAMEPKSP